MACTVGTDFTIIPSNVVQPSCANGNIGYVTHTNVNSDLNGPYIYIWLKNGQIIGSGTIPEGVSVTHGLIPNEQYQFLVVNQSTNCFDHEYPGSVIPDPNCPIPTEEPEEPCDCTQEVGFTIDPSNYVPASCANGNIGSITHSTVSVNTSVTPFYIMTENGAIIDTGSLPLGSSVTHDLIGGNTYQFIVLDPLTCCRDYGSPSFIPFENCCEVTELNKQENFNCQ